MPTDNKTTTLSINGEMISVVADVFKDVLTRGDLDDCLDPEVQRCFEPTDASYQPFTELAVLVLRRAAECHLKRLAAPIAPDDPSIYAARSVLVGDAKLLIERDGDRATVILWEYKKLHTTLWKSDLERLRAWIDMQLETMT